METDEEEKKKKKKIRDGATSHVLTGKEIDMKQFIPALEHNG